MLKWFKKSNKENSCCNVKFEEIKEKKSCCNVKFEEVDENYSEEQPSNKVKGDSCCCCSSKSE